MGRLQSPTVDLLVVFAAVFGLQSLGHLVGVGSEWFALSAPLARPWTLVTSVYAHASLTHLLTNALALAVIGLLLERFTTRARFHGFVLVTGAIAGTTQHAVSVLVGQPTAVIGASGAILALYGYALAGNPLTGGMLSVLGLSRRAKLVLLALVALGVTALTAAPGVALVAHGTGFVLGLVAGRVGIL